METSQSHPPLATDSFSYSWLVDPRSTSVETLREPSSDFPGEFSREDEEFSHQSEPIATHNFSFDVSISSNDQLSSLPLVHADKLFSNGLLMPVFASTSQSTETSNYASTSNQMNPPSSSSPDFVPLVSASLTQHQQGIFPRKFSRFSRKILQKYLGFLLPSCPIGAGQRRRSKRVDDLNRRAQEVKSLSTTPETVSPRMSTASAYSTWSDYAESSSIYEAILYCKRSSEQ